MSQRGNGIPSQADQVRSARRLFNSIWQNLIRLYGKHSLRFPREFIWLNGAPGAGKGTQTRFIMDLRQFTHGPIVVSDLLTSPGAQKIKAAGGLVGDAEVLDLVLRELLDPKYASGVVIDGFPRTRVQAECLKCLHWAMSDLRMEQDHIPESQKLPHPIFHIVTLYVDESISVARQMFRGEQNRQHNAEVRKSGVGQLKEERATDFDEAKALRRYRAFKESTNVALQDLRQVYPYHFINAQATIQEVGESIAASMGRPPGSNWPSSYPKGAGDS